MKIQYEYTFGLPRKIVWKYLKHADILKHCLPGCKEFRETAPASYKGAIDINLGPIHDQFILHVERLKEKAPSYYQLGIRIKGKLGDVDAKSQLFLQEVQGAARLQMETDGEVTGSIAIVGDWILENGAKKSLDKFFQGLEKEIKRDIYKKRR